MELNEFAKLVERSVRAQLRAGRRLVASSWGNVNHSGDDISCGCAATMLVREQFGAEDALYIIRNEDDENANDRFIADLFDCQPSNIRKFRIGFDGVIPRHYDSDWHFAGYRVRQCFVNHKIPTSLPQLLLLEEGDKFLQLVMASTWTNEGAFLGAKSLAYLLRRGQFDQALDGRRHHKENIAKSSLVLDKWLTEFFGE